MFNYYADVAAFPDEDAVASMESANACMVNIDGKCIPTVPLAGRAGMAASNGAAACPQSAPLFCAANQPYGSPNGWSCATATTSLAQRGV